MAASLAKICDEMRVTGKSVTGLFPFPENSKNLKLMALERMMHVNGVAFSEALICRRILSDSRSMPFKVLNVVLPYHEKNGEEATENEERELPFQRYSSLKSINIRKGDSNKTKGNFSWGNLPGLIETFPKDVSLTITRQKNSIDSRSNRKSVTKKNITVSSSTMSGPVITPAIRFKPPLYSRQLFGGQIFEPGERQALFQRLLNSLPIERNYFEIVGQLSENNRLRFDTLFDAQIELQKLSRSENLNRSDKKFVLEIPSEWGGWAKLGKRRGRYIAGIEFISEGTVNYVFEVELGSKNEACAIGVISHSDGQALGLYDHGCIFSHCFARVRLRGRDRKASEAYIGIWPDETEYMDVVGHRIIHTEKFRHPHYLAKKIQSLTRIE